MLWVSKRNISAVCGQSVCVFISVITKCVEVYLWFALFLSSCLGNSSYNFPVVVCFWITCQIGQEKILRHKFVSQPTLSPELCNIRSYFSPLTLNSIEESQFFKKLCKHVFFNQWLHNLCKFCSRCLYIEFSSICSYLKTKASYIYLLILKSKTTNLQLLIFIMT